MMRIVAEMMIYANAAVGERLFRAFPRAALLRRHPPPRRESFAEVPCSFLFFFFFFCISWLAHLQCAGRRLVAAVRYPAALPFHPALPAEATVKASPTMGPSGIAALLATLPGLPSCRANSAPAPKARSCPLAHAPPPQRHRDSVASSLCAVQQGAFC